MFRFCMIELSILEIINSGSAVREISALCYKFRPGYVCEMNKEIYTTHQRV